MLRPADIADRDFLVVVHGYHKGEVREFLAEISQAYASLTERLEQASEQEAPARDDFEDMGAEIASVLRAAKEAAAAMTADADAKLSEAEALLADARREADELLAQATAALGQAQESARRAEQEAQERSQQIVREAEEQAHAHRIEAEAGVRARLDAIRHHEREIRDRLEHLGDAVRDATVRLDSAPGEHIDLDAMTSS
jgi:DivIVA domain-containing protein